MSYNILKVGKFLSKNSGFSLAWDWPPGPLDWPVCSSPLSREAALRPGSEVPGDSPGLRARLLVPVAMCWAPGT